MNDTSFQEAITRICARDKRFAEESYYFLREALDFTTKSMEKPENGPERHVSGQDLLQGVRRYALQEFGPMALAVLNNWGIHRTEDIGELVFNLVEAGKLAKTERDRREDFANGFDFVEAFAKPYEVEEPARAARRSGRRTRAR